MSAIGQERPATPPNMMPPARGSERLWRSDRRPRVPRNFASTAIAISSGSMSGGSTKSAGSAGSSTRERAGAAGPPCHRSASRNRLPGDAALLNVGIVARGRSSRRSAQAAVDGLPRVRREADRPQCPRLAREKFLGHSPRCPPLPREQCTGQNRPNVLLSREEFSGQNSRPHSPDLVRHMECCDRDGSELSHMALPNSASGTLVVDKPGREATRWPPAPSHEHAASATRLAPLVNGGTTAGCSAPRWRTTAEHDLRSAAPLPARPRKGESLLCRCAVALNRGNLPLAPPPKYRV